MATLYEVFNFIVEQEQSLNLFNLKDEDTFIWPIIRVNVGTAINKALNLTQTPQDPLRNWNRFERYSKGIKYDWFNKPKKHVDTIIVEHPRKSKTEEGIVDIYTHELQKEYPNALVLNRLEANAYGKNQTKIFLQESVLDKYNKKTQERIANMPSFYEFEILTQAIEQVFHVHVDVTAIYQDRYKHFICGEERWLDLLERIKPQEVILVVAYVNYDIVSACKKKGIKVIEVQHGNINELHFGYHYPNPIPAQCFVDELWLFAPFWRLNAKLPLSEEHLKYIGFKYFQNESSKIQATRDSKSITVLSQGTSGKAMLEMVLKLAEKYPDYTINYKLHPGEFSSYKERYPALVNHPTINVYTNEVPLYKLLKEATYVIGGDSTAVYEALALGCTGILVDVPGVRQCMRSLIEYDLVYISKDLAKDFEFIVRDGAKKDVKNIYF